MPAAIFFPADFELPVERAGRRCNDIAAQNSKAFPRFNEFVITQRPNKCTVIVFAESTEPDCTGHRDSRGWSRRGRERNSSTPSPGNLISQVRSVCRHLCSGTRSGCPSPLHAALPLSHSPCHKKNQVPIILVHLG